MKIKRFNNLWAMGLIIFIGILLSVYLIKIINPGFIVGVAETESVVRIGTYIDTHKWAYYLATIILSFVMEYFYCCACCRKTYLNWKDIIVICGSIIISLLSQEFLPQMFSVIDICLLVAMPILINFINKNNKTNLLYSLGITFIINNISQILSLQIRDIGMMIAQYNFASLFVLVIDGYIWLIILYFYFNFKRENK